MKNSINQSRRGFLKTTAITALGATLTPSSLFASLAIDPDALKIYRSKAMGCFMGAAIADAMGGPTEGQHYLRIAKEFPDFQDPIPHNSQGTFLGQGPGNALEPEAGNITDDTYIRMDLAAYMLQTNPPYNAASFAPWLLKNANFSNWWHVAVKALKRIENGEVLAEDAGLNHQQGGGGGWWQPVAMLYAGDPKKASEVTTAMCKSGKPRLNRTSFLPWLPARQPPSKREQLSIP